MARFGCCPCPVLGGCGTRGWRGLPIAMALSITPISLACPPKPGTGGWWISQKCARPEPEGWAQAKGHLGGTRDKGQALHTEPWGWGCQAPPWGVSGRIPRERVQPGAAVTELSPTARGTPAWGTLGCCPPSLGAPIPGDTGDPHPTSPLLSGRSSTPTPTPRWGGLAGSGFGEMGRVSMATERDDDSRHGEAAWPGPLPWRCAWHSRSPWRWPRDGAVPMAGMGWDGGKGGVPGAEPPNPALGASPVPPPARCRLVPGAAAAARDHFHEAFPLQFTLPSDRPNFSFSE